MLALSISRFGDVTAFKRQVDAIARDIRGSGKLPGVSEIRMPGDRAYAVRQERTRDGIPVPPACVRRSTSWRMAWGSSGWVRRSGQCDAAARHNALT